MEANEDRVRDLVAYEALHQLAHEAAERLSALAAAGDEIEFEVVEEPGGSAPLYCYRPLTAPYVRRHAAAIGALPSFGAACAAVASSGAAERYLDSLDQRPPADPRDHTPEALLGFLARLWHDAGEFTLEGERFEATFREWERSGGESAHTTEVIVPVIGLHIPDQRARLCLRDGLALVRGDSVDVPPEACRPEGQARTAWEPHVLAGVRFSEDTAQGPAPVTAAQLSLRALVTALRLFKPGGVGLGPHAWARVGAGRWRRLSTGAPAVRGGGYWLTEAEVHEFAALHAAIAARPLRGGGLAWAVARFEMGAERRAPLDGLSDHLLALRALLEGGGAAAIGIPARVAGLCAEPEQRHLVRAAIERAFALECSLMQAIAPPTTDQTTESFDLLAAEVEDHLRAILRDAAAGHLGNDLRTTADEILLADGLDIEKIVEPDPEPITVTVAQPEPVAVGAIEQEQPIEDWMSQANPYQEHTLQWPVKPDDVEVEPRETRPARHLFPVPETTEWSVNELPPRHELAAARSALRPQPRVPIPTFESEPPAFDAVPAPAFEPHQSDSLDDDTDCYSAPI